MRRALSSVAACALVAMASLPAAANAKTLKKTFSSGNVNLTIPEPFGIFQPDLDSIIRVKYRGRIRDVDVAVRITIPDDRDLGLSVDRAGDQGSPPGRGQLNQPKGPDFGAGPTGCGGTPTVFDSQATTPILQGSPPFLGSYVPVNSLNGFNRGRVDGKWRLTVTDQFPGSIDGTPANPGVLNCWKVTVRYKPQGKK